MTPVFSAAISGALLGAALGTIPPAMPNNELMDRVSSWLTAYEPQLSALVAEETLIQQFLPEARSGLRAYRQTLVSTISFVRLPDDGAWLGLREVKRLNGTPIPAESKGLLALLRQPVGERGSWARALAVSNARHNLGYPRTTNMPTLPLELMHPRNRARYSFHYEGSESIARMMTARMSFVEQTRPTLIRSPDGTIDLLTRGTLWIEPETGRFRQAEVEAFLPEYANRPEWTLKVTFDESRDVGMWVPSELREHFVMLGGRGEGRGKYTKFQRFTTSGRIIDPRPR